MIIYVLDDEPIALKGTIKTIKEVVPESETKGFSRARDVFEYVTENKESPDVVFSDIEMPGINGLDFAVQFKRICPETKIIFVTAYSEYALEAFRLHVHGYILKPVMAERVREELDHVLTNSMIRRGENGEKIEAREAASTMFWLLRGVLEKAAPDVRQETDQGTSRLSC